MPNRNVTRRAASALLFPLLFLTGCSSVLGLGPRLAPEDEPYLFDRWDPDFELAKPCEDLAEDQLDNLGLSRMESKTNVKNADGMDACSFYDEEFGFVMVSGSAVKLRRLSENGVPLQFELSQEKQPALAYSKYGDVGCGVAAETDRGTVEVYFESEYSSGKTPMEDCSQADKYFDLLIGEKLNEYRTN